MISMENRDTVQRNHEASIRSLQNKGCFCPPLYNATHSEGIPESPKGPYAQSGGSAVDQDSLSSEHIESSDESTQRPLYYHDFGRWPSTPPCQVIAFQGHFLPVAMNYRFQRAPVNLMAQTYPHDNQFQDFQYFVVIDFEATCDKERVPFPQEIIEFPSVIVSSITGQLEACFQTYVRPTCNQHLSDFCKDLTGIQQTQVDTGVTLSEALLRHDKWLENKGIKNTNFAVVTWSDWDCRVMLESECRYKQLRKPPYFNRWINLKVPFQEVYGGGRCNLKEAVERAGLAWEGRAHCGLDDAKNTARLLALLMQKGFKFSITNSLANQPNNELTWKPTPVKALFVWPQAAQRQCLRLCYCGVKSSKGMVRKPGPTQGSVFFGCGHWTAARGARCQYFEWASVTS